MTEVIIFNDKRHVYLFYWMIYLSKQSIYMVSTSIHTFHIPVLGVAYSIDTPLKVAKYGISSVISIMGDELLEQMRKYHAHNFGVAYTEINTNYDDYRAKRITAYLDLISLIVETQIADIKRQTFGCDSDITKYFELLPDTSALKTKYNSYKALRDSHAKDALEQELRDSIVAGSIDVNIMAKVDRINSDSNDMVLPAEYSDALSALRGFANSRLRSSVVLSAGYNPKLYNYIEQFSDFFPDENGTLKKKIILKVSDYRSAIIQGKILAKKGLLVSEFRIESGLNCGGHAFATEGLLLGPILEEFKIKRNELTEELHTLCETAYASKKIQGFLNQPQIKVTVQGGVGTAKEQLFLQSYYKLDSIGWGSPFLLVPEVTNVDNDTLNNLANAEKNDYYLSNASPLGVPFNNFKKSSAELQRKERIAEGRPGSPCYKKHLITNTEFTTEPICTASRLYQHLKIKQLNEKNLTGKAYENEYNAITEKDCLCEGLGAPVLIKDELPLSHNLSAVTICPGPNLAYFSSIMSLSELVGHIYGRVNKLNTLYRPHMFINELELYINYFKKEIEKYDFSTKQIKHFRVFKANLLEGIEYYKELVSKIENITGAAISKMKDELMDRGNEVNNILVPAVAW